MDIANPVGSEISSVDFGFLSSDDIKRLSVKQIVSPDTLDKLQHPIPGGLYDLALGAFGKNLCATCGLGENFCPGHIGHIQLPVPAYNPLFFIQVYNFLRASCIYCHRFKLRDVETHKYKCKLNLLQYGLIPELEALEGLQVKGFEGGDDSDEAEEGEEENGLGKKASKMQIDRRYAEQIKSAREAFVQKTIKEALESGRASRTGVQTATVLEERKKVVHELIKALVMRKKCDNCGMFSEGFRKDGYVKIFQTALTPKQVANNQVKGLERPDLMFERKQARKGDIGELDLSSVPTAKAGKNANRYLLSTEARNILRYTFMKEQDLCKVLFQVRPDFRDEVTPDMFFIHSVVVPPTRFRAPQQLGDEIHSNMQSDLIAKILTTTLRIRDLTSELSELVSRKIAGQERSNAFNMLMNSIVTIQSDVNGYLDSSKVPQQGGQLPIPGVKQALEKKEGLFRKNMMGKRVNYAARSVISPDPNLETSEIGVPPVFAVKLTYPEPVTAYNVAELRKAVINGPFVWPGATQIQNEDGSLVSLLNMTLEQRTALANQLQTPSTSTAVQGVVNKKVYRHIRNQDVVLMNRQPTLHKASMMGHKVRVLPKEKTLRLHYANTGAYNADFDGDEMNMHFPQNENARAEAFLLANTDSQYITPTSGKPLRGLIQDHISAGVWLTNKDTFFSREEYQQLIYGSVRPEDGHTTQARIVTVPPAIFKPVPLWTGKQVITTCLLNIKPLDRPGLNVQSKNKIKNEYWGPHSTENNVVFKDGELIMGILDKSQYGASDHGLVHSVHEVYGATSAGSFLSVLGRLFTKYIMKIAFTCGMEDLHLTEEGDKWRKDILAENREVGLKAAVEVANLPPGTKSNDPVLLERLEEILRDDNKLGVLDAITQSKAAAVTSGVVAKCIPAGVHKKFPENNMLSMALSGAKGSNVNVSQIMCMLGQQALEGRRVPVMVSGKTLPSFKPFETVAKAGGYIAGRFFSGIKPQEYYFHCMAGREGLIDTAVKTSRSGYLQRCLIKQLEGVHTNYDNTVRDSDGTLIQFLYGGDAIDVTRESHLREFDFCYDNFEALLRKHQPSSTENLETESAVSYAKKVRKHLKKNANEPHYLHPNKYDPVLSKYNPSRSVGSVSERFSDALEAFIEKNPKLFPKDKKNKGGITEKKFQALMQLKYMQSIVDPGEAVGIIASQSIGEPSTQMTLNTFHFAGHGAANVTLGIPRMREIIMTASANIKTPQMTLPILKNITDEQADAFCRSVAKVNLSELVDNVLVTERTGITESGSSARSYSVRIQFFPEEEYQAEYDVSKKFLEEVLVDTFVTSLEMQVIKAIKKQKQAIVKDIGEKQKSVMGAGASSSSRADVDEDSDEEEDGDDERAKGQTKQSASYDEPDEEEAAIMKKSQKEADEFDDVEAEEGHESSDESDDEGSSPDDSDVEMGNSSSSFGKLSVEAKNRQSSVITSHKTVKAFNFDDENGEWCELTMEFPAETKKLLMVNIIEDLCRSHVVREVKNIGRCLRPTNDKNGRVLVTEGVNFAAMWEEDLFVDVNDIKSNDISAVLRTYGVEAARNTIVREINNVFETYAITVNLRHLELIADMMTREGTYLPFNRQGVDTGTSPFMKMSFETTCQFLTKAVLDGDSDDLESPSARIVVGKINKVGTGSFDLFTRVDQPVAA